MECAPSTWASVNHKATDYWLWPDLALVATWRMNQQMEEHFLAPYLYLSCCGAFHFKSMNQSLRNG